MPNRAWEYFLAIESDLEKTCRYVELHEENFATFSIEYARLLLAAASEADVLCKRLSAVANPSSRAEKIPQYRQCILSRFPNLPQAEVHLPRFDLKVRPWSDWTSKDSPGWWTSYQQVKHSRDTHYRDANLENVIMAVSGVFVFLLYLHKHSGEPADLYPDPTLLSWATAPGFFRVRPGLELPDS